MALMKKETVEQQMADSTMIVKQITSGDFRTYDEAEQAIVALYVPDLSVSRSGISHALGQLKKHFASQETPDAQ